MDGCLDIWSSHVSKNRLYIEGRGFPSRNLPNNSCPLALSEGRFFSEVLIFFESCISLKINSNLSLSSFILFVILQGIQRLCSKKEILNWMDCHSWESSTHKKHGKHHGYICHMHEYKYIPSKPWCFRIRNLKAIGIILIAFAFLALRRT